ncbi:helix-turn-helix transcriptional regulator [Nocardioides lijunqiniae]|uniref:helix-turn-helix transcriptional regulator n=1 Tax=Nocardioides lijunqiniae TaxID=2760832 RepID=UPI001D0CB9DB|nr:helix-turn-helix transcriptional regulator [Nocardioides lijunqiniae]
MTSSTHAQVDPALEPRTTPAPHRQASAAFLVTLSGTGSVHVVDLATHPCGQLVAHDPPDLQGVDEARLTILAADLLRHLGVLPDDGVEDNLSDRERQVLTLVAEGYRNREIAGRLYLSPNSVKTYIRTAYRKMGVTHRTQAVRWCLARGYGEQPILGSAETTTRHAS